MRSLRLLVLMLALPWVVACFEEEEEDTTLTLTGDVTDAMSGEPIGGAAVRLYMMDWFESDLLNARNADANGRYELVWENEGYCPESLFALRAEAIGYDPLIRTFTTADSVYVRCTEDVQEIDFALTPLD